MTNDDEAERVRQAEEELLGVIDLDEVDRRTIDPTTDISITSLLRHKHNALADHVAKLEERSKEHHAEIELWREGLDKDWAQWSEGGSADIKGFIERQEKALAAFAQDHADRIEKLSGRIDDLVERHRLNMVAEDLGGKPGPRRRSLRSRSGSTTWNGCAAS